MEFLDKEMYNTNLYKYYKEHYGERDTDEWHEPPAVNVWWFVRDGELITLTSHIFTGEVTARTETVKINKN